MSHSWQIMLHGMGGADCGDGEQGRCTVQAGCADTSIASPNLCASDCRRLHAMYGGGDME